MPEERKGVYIVRDHATDTHERFTEKDDAIAKAEELTKNEETTLISVTHERVVWVWERRALLSTPCPGEDFKAMIENGYFT